MNRVPALAISFLCIACGGSTDSGSRSPALGSLGGTAGSTMTGGAGGTGGRASGGEPATGGSSSGGVGGAIVCEGYVYPQRVGFCRTLVNPDPLKPQGAPPTMAGPVLVVGGSSMTTACVGSVSPADSFMFQIADEFGEVWEFSVRIAGFENPLKQGDVIHVSSLVPEVGPWDPTIASLTVRDANGALLFHVTEGGLLENLVLLDGLSLAQGDVSCSGGDVCGSWDQYALVATTSDGTVELPYLGNAQLGPYRLLNGGFAQQTSIGQCADWSMFYVALGVVPAADLD